MTENEIGTHVLNACFKIHSRLGPGLYEKVYRKCLTHELTKIGLIVQHEVPVPIVYEGVHFDEGYRLDLLINGIVILEVKSVEALTKTHRKQLHTYLKLKDCKLGYLLNFGDELMKNGIVRMVNGLEE